MFAAPNRRISMAVNIDNHRKSVKTERTKGQGVLRCFVRAVQSDRLLATGLA